jgi:hypothetical protein
MRRRIQRDFGTAVSLLVLMTTVSVTGLAAQQRDSVPKPDSVGISMDPRDAKAMQGEMMNMMVPYMARMAEANLNATLTALSKPEAAERLATFSRNYYQALMKKGFSKDDALRIVASTGIPQSGGVPR